MTPIQVRAVLLISAMATLLSGCVVPLALDRPFYSMQDDELLTYYYQLHNASGDTDRGLSGMQRRYGADRVFGGPNQALGNVIVQGVIAGGGSAIRERAVHVRVELERRGWTPAKGLPQRTTVTNQTSSSPQLNVESKYLFSAEQWAKGNGCNSPVAILNAKGAGFETFTVRCGSADPVPVRCEYGTCRGLN